MALSAHLRVLEAESIHILREAAAQSQRPVMLYSIGKDSSVLLHLARKAFRPAPLPFPLLHVDTTWKFRAMTAFRDRLAQSPDVDVRVFSSPQGIAEGINPFTHGSVIHNKVWKTDALKAALDLGGHDLAIAGARRDEERSRAKERIFSLRAPGHTWDPKRQRPELWHLYNASVAPGETVRAFPLSNWTELDIWTYIEAEGIELVDLYFAKDRPVVERDGVMIMVDDDRFQFRPGEKAEIRRVRFRSIGCYPFTAAIASDATTLAEIVAEMRVTKVSERSGRLIDTDQDSSMEMKKREGYF